MGGGPLLWLLRARGLWLGQCRGHRDHHKQRNDGRGAPCKSQEELEVLPDVTEMAFKAS